MVTQAEFDNLKKKFDELNKKHEKLKRDFIANKDPLGKMDLDDEMGTASDAINNQVNRVNALTDSIKNLSQAGLNFKDRNDLKAGLSESIESIDLLLGSAKLGAKSYQELAKGMGSFAEMAKVAGSEGKSFTGVLAKHQAALKQAGLATSDFQAVVDVTMFSLKGTADEIEGMNLKLANFARQSGISTDRVSKNFQTLAKNMMLDSANIEQELIKTSKVEQQTGVSVQKQMAALSGVTTDFGAASKMAGSLNALLGGNKLSATELFMSLGPGEVQEKIKAALAGTRMEEDITTTATDRTSVKRRQLAIHALAKNTGFSPDEIRRLYGLGAEGKKGPQGSAQAEMMKSTNKTFASATRDVDGFGKRLKEGSQTIEEFTKTTLRSQKRFTALWDLEARARELGDPGPALLGQQEFMLKKQFGGLTGMGGVSFGDLIRGGLDTGQMQSLSRLAQLHRMNVVGEDKVKAIFAKIKSEETRDQGFKELDAIVNEARPFPGARPGVGYVQRAYRRKFQGGAFGVAEMIRSGDYAGALDAIKNDASLSQDEKAKLEADIQNAQAGTGTVGTQDPLTGINTNRTAYTGKGLSGTTIINNNGPKIVQVLLADGSVVGTVELDGAVVEEPAAK